MKNESRKTLLKPSYSHQHCKKLFIFFSVVKCEKGIQCYFCAGSQSKTSCAKTMTCPFGITSCYALAVKAKGITAYTQGCATKEFCGSDSSLCKTARKGGATDCAFTCCSTSKCNNKLPKLNGKTNGKTNGGSSLVLGAKSMVVSVIVAFALLWTSVLL